MSARAGALLLVLGCAAGCVRLTVPAPEIRDYRLDYPPPAIAGTPLPSVLRLAPFGVSAVYDREAIVYRENAYDINTYAYHRWMTNPASMVRDLLARDFAASGLYRAVQHGPSLLPSDYELSGAVEEIEEQLAGGCVAHLRLRVLLLRVRGGKADPVVFHSTYAADEPCASSRPLDLVAAMSRALEQISARLQRDTYDAIAAHAAAGN